MDFLPANSGFAVQNDGKYLPRITRETFIQVIVSNIRSYSTVVSFVSSVKLNHFTKETSVLYL